MAVHRLAHVDPTARLAEDVVVGPYCHVGPDTVLERGVVLHSHVHMRGHLHVGRGCVFYPFCSIAEDPQDRKYAGERIPTVLGENNIFREYVTVHAGTARGKKGTTIGSNNFFMVGSHVAHDCTIGNHTVLANHVSLGGHVRLGSRVTIGGHTAIHQKIRIGDLVMISGMLLVLRDIPPYALCLSGRKDDSLGSPGSRVDGVNLVGLRRFGVPKDSIRVIKKTYNLLGSGQQIDEESMQDPYVENLVSFYRGATERGVALIALKN